MKKLCLGLSFAAMALLVACGDDNGSSADDLIQSSASGESLSSSSKAVESNASEGSSSSESEESSSSNAMSDGPVMGMMTDERDGQTYKTVKIGSQTWMAENLNYRYLGPTADEDSSSFCYDGDPANCDAYGRLYFWSAAMDSAGIIEGNTANSCGYSEPPDNGYDSECSASGTVRGVCPQGWHLPSESEWNALIAAVGGSSVAGKALKSKTGWILSSDENTDAFGFSALPVGGRFDDGKYDCEGEYTVFWVSNENDSYNAYCMYLVDEDDEDFLVDEDDEEYLFLNSKFVGFSVRCLKD